MRRFGAVAAVTLIMALGANLASGYETAEVKDGGTLTGTVKFVGEPPKQNPIPVKKNRDLCGDAVPSEALVLGLNKGVKYAVVWIEGITKGKKPGTTEVVLDNVKCLFAPHAGAVAIRGKAAVKNSDPILHNTHGFLEKVTVFNLALPNQDQVIDITRRLKKPGVVEIQCDAHTHMRGWLVVREDPYFSVTDGSGTFKITDIPAGRYKVTAWHEPWKVVGEDKDGRPIYDKPVAVTKDVTIPAKGEVKVDFELR
jgi:hypothetical protein